MWSSNKAPPPLETLPLLEPLLLALPLLEPLLLELPLLELLLLALPPLEPPLLEPPPPERPTLATLTLTKATPPQPLATPKPERAAERAVAASRVCVASPLSLNHSQSSRVVLQGSRAARALLSELADLEARAEEGLEVVKRQVSGWLWA